MTSSGRQVSVFFYGLFMDPDVLRAKGLDPVNVRPARVPGMRVRIGRRAALEPDPRGSTYGFLMELTHAEIERLYSDPAVAMYRPEAVLVEPAGGSRIPALCYNLPVIPSSEEHNPEYAAKLRTLAARLGLPGDYIESLS
jgi:hypothetical protein